MGMSGWIKIYAGVVVGYGFYMLLGAADFSYVSSLMKGLPYFAILAIYAFMVLYGVTGVYCGMRMMRFENWARRVIVVMTSVSLIQGFLIGNLVMSNFKEFVMSGKAGLPVQDAGMAYQAAAFMTVISTILEISILVFFTRGSVIKSFDS
ncbi:MAG TPA: hypothetical protein PKY78_02825 [Candidatus Omnitrophota bacterium]|mgnify:CR=1 FL=1|nr:hypothetical protein [Candidatus Omnitrophota bacterium]HPS19908.1 hypothetical protein [Candidatus Omnitrophota bacterium]